MAKVKIDKFRRFGFTNTTYVTGSFERIGITDKAIIKDCNFKFKTDKFEIDDLSDMFNGCTNAVFSRSLTISSDSIVKKANRMFKDCQHAVLNNVRIEDSNLEECNYMFDGCLNATLNGIKLPKNIKSAVGMFRRCCKSDLSSLTTLSNSLNDCTEMFYGCTKATFSKLEMPRRSNSAYYDFPYMFYGCENLDSDCLGFDHISDYTRNSDFMFYAAGKKNSQTFDNCVVNFGNIMTCTSMFDSSRFSFNKSYFQFYSYGSMHGYKSKSDISSIRRMFYNTKFVEDVSPVVVLSDIDTSRADEIDSAIENKFGGHYIVGKNNVESGILDFTEAYSKSNIKTADLRGISNNTSLDLISRKSKRGFQNFTSMFEGCGNLKKIKGKIPSNGYTYKNMFNGCENLSDDISSMFGYDENKNSLDSYYMSSIEGMFNGCSELRSSSDDFDLSELTKRVVKTISEYDGYGDEMEKTSLKDSFSNLKIATKNPIRGLELVDYDITDISKNYGIIRYNSFEDDPYDTEGASPSKYGINSKYARLTFSSGFLRFGGFLRNEPTKYFFLIEKPLIDVSNGEVTSFYVQSKNYSTMIVPSEFSTKFKSDVNSGYWNEYYFDKVYAAKVYDSVDGSFIGNKYVGSYTRTYNEKRIEDGEFVTIRKTYEMPVTYFNCFSEEDDIFVD